MTGRIAASTRSCGTSWRRRYPYTPTPTPYPLPLPLALALTYILSLTPKPLNPHPHQATPYGHPTLSGVDKVPKVKPPNEFKVRLPPTPTLTPTLNPQPSTLNPNPNPHPNPNPLTHPLTPTLNQERLRRSSVPFDQFGFPRSRAAIDLEFPRPKRTFPGGKR